MGGAARIAIVEDDQSLRETLAAVLAHDTYDVVAFESAEAFLIAAQADTHDLVILDLGLPGLDGLQACRWLRAIPFNGPILMLTARHDVSDRVLGLDAGADDYLVKPFALAELQARIRSMLRREFDAAASSLLTLDDVRIDTAARLVVRGTAQLTLTKLEFDLLRMLIANSPNVLSRDLLHERVWGFASDHMSNSLEVAVSQLRRKLELGDKRRLIHTVRGVGYVARVA